MSHKNMKNIKTLLQLSGALYSTVALIVAFADNSEAMFMGGMAALCATGVFTLICKQENKLQNK